MTFQGNLGDVIFGGAHSDDRGASAPSVGRYVSDEGESFVLDRSTGTPLIKFDDSQEVMALSPSPAPRGDIIYRDDVGDPVLRATKLGGLTLFVHSRPGGTPVALEGEASSLHLQALSASGLLQRLAQASLKASRAARRLIVFDAQEVTPGSEAVFADAAAVASDAVVLITHRKDGKTVLSRFNRVLFQPGPSSNAGVHGGVMAITINPSQGLAGRPSSARIVEAAAKGR